MPCVVTMATSLITVVTQLLSWQPQPITEDDTERLGICLRVLAERNELLTQVFGEASRQALDRLLQTRDAEAKKKKVRFYKDTFDFSNLLCTLVNYGSCEVCTLYYCSAL